MADLTKTVAVIFQGEDQISGSLKSISSGLDSMGAKVVGATQPLADMAEKVLKLEAALAALAVGGLALVVTEAGKFGDAFSEISTLINVPAENLDKFREDILAYSRESTSSIEDINSAIYSAISAGVDWSDSIDFVRASEQLAIAGKADLESTTRVLISTLNAYGESTDQAGRYADVFFKTVEKGQVTLPELAEGLAQVTGIADAAGVPIETLNAAIAALTAAGAPVSQAITQVRSALVAIVKPSSQASALAQQLGIDFSVSAVQTKGFENVLQEVYEATGGNADQLALLFGRVEGLNAVLRLGEDANNKFAEALDAMRDSAGAAEAAYQKMADNIGLVNQNLINNVRATLVEAGEPLLDEYAQIARSLSDVFQGVSVGIDIGAFDPVYRALEQFGADLSNTLQEIAALLSDPEFWDRLDFTGLIASVENLGGELADLFNAFFGDVDLTTAEGLSQVLQRIVDGVSAITNVTSGIVDAWEPFVRILGEMVDRFSDAGADTQELAGQILGFGQALNEVFQNIGLLTGGLNLLAGAMSIIATKSLVDLIGGFSRLTGVLGPVLGGLAQFAAVVAAPVVGWQIGSWLSENVPIVNDFTDSVLEAADSIFNFTGAQDVNLEKSREFERQTEEVVKKVQEMTQAVEEVPEQKSTTVEALTEQAIREIEGWSWELDQVPKEVVTTAKAEADQESIVRVGDLIISNLEDTEKSVLIEVAPDVGSITSTKEKIEKEIPPQKIQEIKLQGEIDIELQRIAEQAATIQTAVEWNAKLNIAEVEANAQIVESAFESIQTSMEVTGDVLTGLFEKFGQVGISEQIALERYIEQEIRLQKQLIDVQEDLLRAQVEYIEARTDSLERGDALIQIDGTNLEPELNAFMLRILENIQVWATAEGQEFLIGVGATE